MFHITQRANKNVSMLANLHDFGVARYKSIPDRFQQYSRMFPVRQRGANRICPTAAEDIYRHVMP